MTRIISISTSLVAETIRHLRHAGSHGAEGIVLWLAKPAANRLVIQMAHVPTHEAASDYFLIPPVAMDEVLGLLRRQRLMVAAQVHSHPKEAFHSQADDQWAIVRHEGALSIVVPFFARDTTVSDFMDETATFAMTAAGHWRELGRVDVSRAFEVTL